MTIQKSHQNIQSHNDCGPTFKRRSAEYLRLSNFCGLTGLRVPINKNSRGPLDGWHVCTRCMKFYKIYKIKAEEARKRPFK